MISQYNDYKAFVIDTLKAMPQGGRGQMIKMAKSVKVNQGFLSQVFSGDRDLTPEQSIGVADFLGLSADETQYFLTLVQYARAGTQKLKALLESRLRTLREPLMFVKGRVRLSSSPKAPELRPEFKPYYYGVWYHAAIAMFTWIKELQTPEAIADRLSLPRQLVREVLLKFVEEGLVIEKNGRFEHSGWVNLEKPTPVISSLIINHWRNRAIHKYPSRTEADFMGSVLISLSLEDRKRVHKIAQEAFQKILEIGRDSTQPETVCCLNLDWFDV